MTAVILPFPSRVASLGRRHSEPFAVEVLREDGGFPGWLVRCRDHGWLHGVRRDALADAAEIAKGWGVNIVVRLP